MQDNAGNHWMLFFFGGNGSRLPGHLIPSTLFQKPGAGFGAEVKTLPGKPAVPHRRPTSFHGGGEYATVFTPKSTSTARQKILSGFDVTRKTPAATW
jgi:hypothetical protein